MNLKVHISCLTAANCISNVCISWNACRSLRVSQGPLHAHCVKKVFQAMSGIFCSPFMMLRCAFMLLLCAMQGLLCIILTCTG